MAPVLSVTVPRMVPVAPACPKAMFTVATAKTQKRQTLFNSIYVLLQK
jgi:hypothetical protein